MVEEALREHVVKVGKRLGRSEADVEPFIEILAEHWYDTVESLSEITHEDLQALGIPLRFAKELATQPAEPPAPPEKGKNGKNGKGKGERGEREPKGKGKGDGWGNTYEREDREPKGRGKADGKGERKGEGKGERKGEGKGERKGDKGDRKGDKGKGKGSKGPREHEFTHAIPLDGEDIDPEFPFRDRLAGDQSRNLKHIGEQTSSKVWLSGRPGGAEPFALNIGSRDEASLDKATELASDLVNTIFDEYANWQDQRDGVQDAGDRGPPAIKGDKGGKGGKGKSWGKGRGEDGKGKGKGKKGKGKGKDGDRHQRYDDERPPAKRPRY